MNIVEGEGNTSNPRSFSSVNDPLIFDVFRPHNLLFSPFFLPIHFMIEFLAAWWSKYYILNKSWKFIFRSRYFVIFSILQNFYVNNYKTLVLNQNDTKLKTTVHYIILEVFISSNYQLLSQKYAFLISRYAFLSLRERRQIFRF